MDNRILKKPYIEFVGANANEVTGSANLVRYLNYHILVDYGLRQTNNDTEDYTFNLKRHKSIKPKCLDAIFLTHLHIDHCGLVPKLYKEGCDCDLYIPDGSKGLLTIMWQDSLKIFHQDYERFDRKPLYEQCDIDKALSHVKEYKLHEPIKLNENIFFISFNAQHIVKSRQLYFTFTDGINTKRIGFTGDISDYKNKYWLSPMEQLPYCDVLVAECTYGSYKRMHKERDRKTDVNKLDTAIKYAKIHGSKVIIPTFSLNRLQDILATLYEVYEGNCPLKIVVDAPLGHKISNLWTELIDKDHALWDKISKWTRIYWIKDFTQTEAFNRLNQPLIIIAGGGMASGGRSTYWCKEHLSNSDSYIIFTGYSTPESIAGQIKNEKIKAIKIDGKTVKNRAKVLTLNSFSSHCDYNHLINYYLNAQYNKICLVHAEQDAKNVFSKKLKEELAKQNKTSSVVVVNKNTKTYF